MGMSTTKSRSHRSFALLAASIFLLTFALSACSSSGSSKSGSGDAADITIKDLAFSPDPISVQTGSTVTVKNDDTVTHTVTSDDGTSFNVSIDPGKSATFEAPTTERQYPFHCNIHTSMKAILNVQ
jgi:plastocyanin